LLLEVVVGLVVAVGLAIRLAALEIHHQHHHHKETMAVPLDQVQILVVEAVALVALVGQELIPQKSAVLVEMGLHPLCLDRR
jgi:hypothetical protein